MTDGSQKIYPNTTVANSAIINLSRMSHRLINENLGIEYKHSSKEINAFCSKLKELILSYDESDKSDVRVNFTDYSDSSLDIEVFFYVDIPSLQDYLTFKSKFNCDVKTLADDMNIDLPLLPVPYILQMNLKLKIMLNNCCFFCFGRL